MSAPKNNPPSKKKTQSEILEEVKNEIAGNIEIWLNQFGEPCISYLIDGCTIHLELYSQKARSFIGAILLNKKLTRNLKSNTDDILCHISIITHTQNITCDCFTRTARHGNAIYINLANAQNEVVEITPEGWQIIKKAPVKFITPRNMLELPSPCENGNFEALNELINVETEEDKFMLISWLINSFFPDGAYPILLINGQQGSAKTSTSKLMRSLIDPNVGLVRAMPNYDRDLMISAQNGWILCFDNLSYISHAMSDALCRLATGAGMGVRQLYSDKEELIFNASRPIILNGIDRLTDRSDLIERCIAINLPTIPSNKRKTDEEIKKLTTEALLKAFGRILDLIAKCLKNLPDTKPEALPRMADFAKRIIAIEEDIGWQKGQFLDFYNKMQENAAKDASDGDFILISILKELNGKPIIKLSPTELHQKILRNTPPDKRRYIPSVNKLPMQRLKPTLKQYNIELSKIRSSNQRLYVFQNNNEDLQINADGLIETKLTLEEALKTPL